MTVLLAADLAPAQLQELLAAWPAGPNSSWFCWLEDAEGWTLDRWPGRAGCVRWYRAAQRVSQCRVDDVLPRLLQGRVFSPAGELRWRVLPALGETCCRTVYLGQRDTAPTASALKPPSHSGYDQWTCRSERYPLWGQQTRRTPDSWIDLRIPHRLQYPVDTKLPDAGRNIAYLKVETWYDTHGEPQWVRLCDLESSLEP
jgi:hypothetical protein